MKILYNHRTQGAGAEGIHIQGIVLALRSLGHLVTVIGPLGEEISSSTETTTSPVQSGDSKKRSFLKKFAHFTPEFLYELVEVAYNVFNYFKLSKSVKASSPDLIYERYSLFLFSTVLLAKHTNTKVILEINDSAFVPRVRPLFFQKIAQRLERWAVQNCHGVVCISERFLEILQDSDVIPQRTTICPNAVDPSQFELSEENLSAATDTAQERMTFGYVGAFVYWHGIMEFLQEYLPRLAEAPDIRIKLVGEGVLYQAARDLVKEYNAEDYVEFTGRVAHSEILNHYQLMDAGILPNSNDYGSPMKLFESMAAGAPMLAANYPPIAEIIVDAKNGWLFEAGDYRAMVDRMFSLAGKYQEVTNASLSARRCVLENHLWIHNAESALGLITKSENSTPSSDGERASKYIDASG